MALDAERLYLAGFASLSIQTPMPALDLLNLLRFPRSQRGERHSLERLLAALVTDKHVL